MQSSTRDFTTPLTIMLSGHGITNKRNFVQNIEDWIYGKDVDSRDFMVLWLHDHELTEADRIVQQWAEDIELGKGLVEFTPVDDEDYFQAHKRALDRLFFDSFGTEKAYISFYDPAQDVSLINNAKDLSEYETGKFEFTTLNFDGLIDSFEGYETPELRAKREELEAAQKAQKATRAPRKTAAAKKVAAPLKAAEKPLIEPSRPIVEPVVEYQVGDTVEVAGLTFTKHSEFPAVEKMWDNLTPEEVALVSEDMTPSRKLRNDTMEQLAKDILAMGETLSSMIENFKTLLETNV